jgi:serine O-acetyltransferase
MLFENVRADMRRYTGNEAGRSRKAITVCFNLGLHAVVVYRLSSWLHTHGLTPLSLVVNYFTTVWTGSQISHRAVIGKGFAVWHPCGVTVGATTVIGEGCTLTGQNVIGQRNGTGKRPVIGNSFCASAGAKVIGEVVVGDRVSLGANVVVDFAAVESIPDDHSLSVPLPILRDRTKKKTDLHRIA